MLEHEVDRVAEDRLVLPAPGSEDDDLGATPVGLLDDRTAGIACTDDAFDHAHTVGLGDRAGLVEQLVRSLELLGQVGIERQLERDDHHAQEDDPPCPLGREPRGELDGLA